MISLTREQAEFVLNVLRHSTGWAIEVPTPDEAVDPMPGQRSRLQQLDQIASEIERQLASPLDDESIDDILRIGPKVFCTCNPPNMSMMCPTHGEELAREEIEHELAQSMERWLADRRKSKLPQ